MAWVKVPAENHPIFRAALPSDPRVETQLMFGGIAAKVNGNIFAGLFGRSAIIWLPEPERPAALALEGASWFDPMGDGRAKSDKIMLPETIMDEPTELRRWIKRAFDGASKLPKKVAKAKAKAKANANANANAKKAAAPKKAVKAAKTTKRAAAKRKPAKRR